VGLSPPTSRAAAKLPVAVCFTKKKKKKKKRKNQRTIHDRVSDSKKEIVYRLLTSRVLSGSVSFDLTHPNRFDIL
jgi:hypothetical protein